MCHSTNAAGYIWSLSLGTAASKKGGQRFPIDVQKFWMRTVTSLGLSFMVLALNLMSLMVLQVTGSCFAIYECKAQKLCGQDLEALWI